MKPLNAAHDFIDLASRETDLEALKGLFSAAITPAGFSSFACVSAVDPIEYPLGTVDVVDYPQMWSERYLDQRFDKFDPTLKVAASSSVAFRWSEMPDTAIASKKAQQVLKEAAQVGMCEGVSVGIREPMSFPAIVNVAGEDPNVSDGWVASIHLMAVYLHGAAKRITRAAIKDQLPVNKPLTPREAECLRWVAIGKTDWEIGEIIGISEHTAHFHIENAKRKLNAPTRQQAVVEGMLQGHVAV